MAEMSLTLAPLSALDERFVGYIVDFNGLQLQSAGIRYRLGSNGFSGPVAEKAAVDGVAAEIRLRRELEVARYLGTRGGELLSACVGYNFRDAPISLVVTYRGSKLADLVRDARLWPLQHAQRAKIILDLLQGLELLRVSGIVHGGLDLDTLRWDGTTLQITDFGRAALSGKYPDGRTAHHGDDIQAAGRVIYHVYCGTAPPADPAGLRQQLEHVQDGELRDLLLRRDVVAGTDIDYVFADAPEHRPTARTLLDRLDRRPHGVQWEHLVERDKAIREDFKRLRARQEQVQVPYAAWAQRQSARRWLRPNPPSPSSTGAPPMAAQEVTSSLSLSKPAWLAVAAAILLASAFLFLVAVR